MWRGWTTAAVLALGLMVPCGTYAEEALSVARGDSVRDVLTRQVGKIITVRLRAGEEISGKVQTVGEHVVHLAQLAGRDFYDAAIRVDAIDAVLVRARGK
jgi:hypothetical protein